MKSKLTARIAAGLLLFHLAGHTIGHLGWKNAEEPAKQEVIRQMTDHRFGFMGAVRSMGDYFEGYGWACSIALLFFAITLWLISNHINGNKTLAKKLLLSLGFCLLAWSALEFIFFFAFAGGITLSAVGFIFWAVAGLRKEGE